MSKIGFTGTRQGMVLAQAVQVQQILKFWYQKDDVNDFRHGQCIGSDCQAATLAKGLKYKVIAYPGYPATNKFELRYRSKFDGNDVVMQEDEFIKRDHKIVDSSYIMIATPKEKTEALRSGTWATIRYAITKGKYLYVVTPDGTVKEFCQKGIR